MLTVLLFRISNGFFYFCRINSNFVDALVKLSHILSTKKELFEAESLLKKALQIDPENADILNNYAVLLRSLSKYMTLLFY